MREPVAPVDPLGELPPPLAEGDTEGGGVCLAVQAENPGIEDLGARWYFNWSFEPHPDVDLPFVPLICGYPGDRQVSDAHVAEVEETIRSNPDDYPDGTLFLIGNEIGYTHQQDGRTPREYAEDLHACWSMLQSLDPSYRISVGPAILSTDEGITGAIVEADDGIDYLRQVIHEYRGMFGEEIPAEYFAATNHVQRAGNAELDTFKQRLTDLRALLTEEGLGERSVILTEFGIPTRGSDADEIEWFLQQSLEFVATATDSAVGHPDDGKLVQRFAWFTAQPLSTWDKLQSMGAGAFFLQFAPTSLYRADGTATHLGRVYAGMLGGGPTDGSDGTRRG